MQSEPVTHSERQREARSAVERESDDRNAKVEEGKYSTKKKGGSQTKREKDRGPRGAEQIHQYSKMKGKEKIQARNYFGSVQKNLATLQIGCLV